MGWLLSTYEMSSHQRWFFSEENVCSKLVLHRTHYYYGYFLFFLFFTFYSWNWLCWNALVGWLWKLCRASKLTTYFVFFWKPSDQHYLRSAVFSLARFGKTETKCRLFAQNILVTWAHHTCLNSNIVRSACLLSRVLTQQEHE